jgi:hypothetical protein
MQIRGVTILDNEVILGNRYITGGIGTALNIGVTLVSYCTNVTNTVEYVMIQFEATLCFIDP